MFEIRLLPETCTGPSGQRLGDITVGSFQERFACWSAPESIDGIEARWLLALQALVDGAPFAVLPHDPRFAWVVYREDRACYVQQHLSLDGEFNNMRRETISDDGVEVSEWETNLDAIEDFLRA